MATAQKNTPHTQPKSPAIFFPLGEMVGYDGKPEMGVVFESDGRARVGDDDKPKAV